MSEVWKNVIDADLKDAEYAPSTPIPPGDYNVAITDIKTALKAETGSIGVNVTYTIGEGDHKGRVIRDYINLRMKNGQPNKQGAATVKKLMLEAGLTPKEITSFKFPEPGSNSFGDFKKLLDQPLTVSVIQEKRKDGMQAGKSFPRVRSFKAAA